MPGAVTEDSHAHNSPNINWPTDPQPNVGSLGLRLRLGPLQSPRSSLEKLSPPKEVCLQYGTPKHYAVLLGFMGSLPQ